MDSETTNTVLILNIIREKYPDLSETEIEEVRQQVIVDSVIKTGELHEVRDKCFTKLANWIVNIDESSINLIDSVNPFHRAFEVMSESVTPSALRIIQDQIAATRVEFTQDEAVALFPKIKTWVQVNGSTRPAVRSKDAEEKRSLKR